MIVGLKAAALGGLIVVGLKSAALGGLMVVGLKAVVLVVIMVTGLKAKPENIDTTALSFASASSLKFDCDWVQSI